MFLEILWESLRYNFCLSKIFTIKVPEQRRLKEQVFLCYTYKISWSRWHHWSLKLEGWLFNILIFYAPFNEEAPFHKQYGRGATTLLVNLGRGPYFIGYFREEAPFYSINLGGGWLSFFIYVQNYVGGWLEFHFLAYSLPGGLVIQIELFYCCRLTKHI